MDDCWQGRFERLAAGFPDVLSIVELGGALPPRVLYASEALRGLTGEPDPTWEAIIAATYAEDRGPVQVAAGHPAPTPVDFRLRGPEGSCCWAQMRVAERQAMLLDVTAEKRAEEERRRIEMELRLSQKLEAVGQLAAGIAHEINTPVQFVGDTIRFLDQSFTDLSALVEAYAPLRDAVARAGVSDALSEAVARAEDEADLEYLRERVPAALGRARDGIERVATIVRAIREFAHPPTTAKAPVDLNASLRNTLVVAANEYKYVADVEIELGEIPAVTANAGDLNQVFLNLVVNAAHAIADVVGESGERGTIRVATVACGDHVEVRISDTGGGIPADIAARVFDPFFTTKDVGKGTGQGLAISHTIVNDRHGGSLTFESAVGQGTTFCVRLPVRDDDEETEAAIAA